jgi:hypothetical protein
MNRLRSFVCAFFWWMFLLVAEVGGVRAGMFASFGAGFRSAAFAGAGAGLDLGAEAVFLNPAFLDGSGRGEISLRRIGTKERFRVDGREMGGDDMDGWALGVRTPLGGRMDFGMAAYLPQNGVASAGIYSPADPRPALFDGRHDVLHFVAGAGVRLSPTLGAGLGVRVLAGGALTSPNMIYISNYENPEEEDPDFRYSEVGFHGDFRPEYGLIAGMAWRPRRDAVLALVYHEELYSELDAEVRIDVEIGGLVRVDVPLHVRGRLFYEPEEWVVSGSFSPWERLALVFDLRYQRWSGYRDPRAEVAIGETEVNLPRFREFPPPDFADVLVPALGLRYVLREGLALRVGYSYQRSPAPEQTGGANLLDADRQIFAGGVEWRLPLPASWPLSEIELGAAIQVHRFADRTHHKEEGAPVSTSMSLVNSSLGIAIPLGGGGSHP